MVVAKHLKDSVVMRKGGMIILVTLVIGENIVNIGTLCWSGDYAKRQFWDQKG